MLARLSDSRVAQYWDQNHLFASQLERELTSDSDHPKPHCCTRKGIQWDEVAVYDRGARWDDQLPRAVFLDGPVVRAGDFSKAMVASLSK